MTGSFGEVHSERLRGKTLLCAPVVDGDEDVSWEVFGKVVPTTARGSMMVELPCRTYPPGRSSVCYYGSMARPVGWSAASLDHLSVCRTRLLLSPETQQQTTDPDPRVHRRQCQYHNSIATIGAAAADTPRHAPYAPEFRPPRFRIFASTTIARSGAVAGGDGPGELQDFRRRRLNSGSPARMRTRNSNSCSEESWFRHTGQKPPQGILRTPFVVHFFYFICF